MCALLLTGEVLQAHVALIAEVRGHLQLLEPRVPDGRVLSVGVDRLGAHAGQHAAEGRAQGGGATEKGHLDAGVRVSC